MRPLYILTTAVGKPVIITIDYALVEPFSTNPAYLLFVTDTVQLWVDPTEPEEVPE